MKKILIFVLACNLSTFNIASTNFTKKPEPKVFWLPYKLGTKYKVIQGYNTFIGTHHNIKALDFAMPVNTEIYAASSGEVYRIVDKNTKSGKGKRFEKYNNYIIIKQSDGNFASYLHINTNSSKVKVGDQVNQGDLIALSGKIGRAYVPHLHFSLKSQLDTKPRSYLDTKFLTSDGLRTLKRRDNYTCIHN